MMINRTRTTGFTLMELLVTVAIIGILAAVGYPSYTDYVRRANRADARAMLLENAAFLERNFTTTNRYDLSSNWTTVGNAQLPRTQSPATGTAKYNLAVVMGAAPAQTFTLSATPAGSMAGDACGTYTLTETGVRGSGGSVQTCWDR